jgi:putative hydrolase
LIDFHTHTFLSDGALSPSELVRRAHVIGYRAIGLSDHVDGSNLDFVVPRIIKVAGELNRFQGTTVIPGAEITHAPPEQIPQLVAEARQLGAAIVVVHGESPVEPVAPGTNQAAIEAGVDVLAHPGFITEEQAKLAKEKGVCLEITSRKGHSLTNGHVAKTALAVDATLVVNTDTHAPEDLISREQARKVLIGAGLTEDQAQNVLENNEKLLKRLKDRAGL